jgi:hypothetical protein
MTDRVGAVLMLSAMLVVASTPSAAETYRWVDEQGNVNYSDRPPQPREIRPPTPEAKPTLDPRTPDAKAQGIKAPEVKAPDLKPLDVTRPEMKTPPESRGLDAQSPPRARDAKATIPPLPLPRRAPKIDELLELSELAPSSSDWWPGSPQICGGTGPDEHRRHGDDRPDPGPIAPARGGLRCGTRRVPPARGPAKP